MALQEGFNALHFLQVISLPGLSSNFARSRQALRGRSEAVQEVVSQAGDKWALPSKQSDKMIFLPACCLAFLSAQCLSLGFPGVFLGASSFTQLSFVVDPCWPGLLLALAVAVEF